MSNIINEAALECPQSRYRWVVLAAVWLLYASFGLCMRSLPPLVTPILRDLDMTYSQMGFIMGSWQLVYVPVAVFAGPLLMGGLVDMTDSFLPGIVFFAVTGVILALIILMVRVNRASE